ncbi:MAG: SDR family oxidoreductase [Anaerolineae bacterium]|nr:SDR family oxidoreductase [Anaerolineae bacterium]MBT7075845.1 SDR family oxidoreductase [Anaerolineae bacterium]MBT7782168.1 SDR family oxidoreductase [Anaerolineae bacterium]
MDFEGKRVLITGGSRGIGKACAQAFAARGAKVAINFVRNAEAAQKSLNSLTGEGHALVQADVSKSELIEGLIADTVKALGGLDIVVNNAGISQYHPINEVSYADWQMSWDKIINLNLRAPANVIYWATQYFLKKGGGRIVNVSSRGAFRGEPEMPAYGASKAGLNAMTQSLAQKLAPDNIYLGVVAPGFVETEMVTHVLESEKGDAIRNQSPLGRVAQPEEVAYAVTFLAAEESKFSTGTIIDVNGASYLRG